MMLIHDRLYECFAISALFLLYVQIIAPYERISASLEQIRYEAGENMNVCCILTLSYPRP